MITATMTTTTNTQETKKTTTTTNHTTTRTIDRGDDDDDVMTIMNNNSLGASSSLSSQPTITPTSSISLNPSATFVVDEHMMPSAATSSETSSSSNYDSLITPMSKNGSITTTTVMPLKQESELDDNHDRINDNLPQGVSTVTQTQQHQEAEEPSDDNHNQNDVSFTSNPQQGEWESSTSSHAHDLMADDHDWTHHALLPKSPMLANHHDSSDSNVHDMKPDRIMEDMNDSNIDHNHLSYYDNGQFSTNLDRTIVTPSPTSDTTTTGAVIVQDDDIDHDNINHHNTGNKSYHDTTYDDESFLPPIDFMMGDHIYRWCHYMGIPHMYQHHAIVLDVYYCHIEHVWVMQIADFSNTNLDDDDDDEDQEDDHNMRSLGSIRRYDHTSKINYKKNRSRYKSNHHHNNSDSNSCIRVYECVISTKQQNFPWHKVEYNAPLWKRSIYRSGTCTASLGDAPGLVRARVQFLLNHQQRSLSSSSLSHTSTSSLLPPYSTMSSNCECVAVWCKTGTWCTLQVSSFLYVTAATQMKQAATLAGLASAATVTVPASGIWGTWFGYTTTVSLTSTQPLLLPAIATYGLITTAGPALWLLRAKRQWHDMTKTLNDAFWDDAIHHPDIFVECIQYWSSTNPSNHSNNNHN